jgi:hypothetical protein
MWRKIYVSIARWLRDKWNRISCFYSKNRIHCLIAFACVLVGFLVGILVAAKGGSSNSGGNNPNGLINNIANRVYSPLSLIFFIALFTTIAYLAIYIASIRYWLFWLFGYGGIFIGTLLFWRSAVIAIATAGFLGILYLILFMIPVFIFDAIFIIIVLAHIYEACGFSNNRRNFPNLACHWRMIFRVIKRPYLQCLLFNLIFGLVMVIVFYI